MNVAIAIGHIFECFIWLLFAMSTLERRYKKWIVIIFILVPICSLQLLVMQIQDMVIIRGFTGLVINFLLLCIMFKDNMWRKVCITLVYLVSVIFVEILFFIIGKYIIGIDIITVQTPNIAYFVLQYGCYLTLFLITQISAKFLKSFKNDIDTRISLYIYLYIFSQLLVVYIIAGLFYTYRITSHLMLMFLILVIICSAVLITWTYKKFINETEKKMEEKRQKEILEIRDSHYSAIKEQYVEMKKVRHDFENHLQTINCMVHSASYNQAESYMKDLRAKLDGINNTTFSTHPAIDAILFYKIQMAQDCGIKVSVKIIDPPALQISDIDICSLLSNMLDNAIEAVKRYNKDKYIDIETSIKKSNYVITIRNSTTYTDCLETIKADKQNHGLGIGIIREIAEKYGGEAVFKCMGEEFVAVVYLII